MKRIIGLLIIVAVIVVIWSGVWLFFARQIESQVVALATPASDDAPSMTCEQTTMAGWPFRFDLTCTQMTLVDKDLTLRVDEIKATALVYRPTHILAFANGAATLSDAFFGTEQVMRWSKLEASLRTNGWQLARLSVHAEDVEYADALLGETLRARASQAEFHLLDMPEQENEIEGLMTLGAFARINSADIPSYEIENGELTLEAEASALPDDIRFWGTADLLAQWQAAGGKLKITRFETSDPSASLNLLGDIGLSATGEAEGAMTLTSSGLDDRLEAILSPQMRGLVLGNLQDDDTYRQVLTIRRGAVFAGLTPLATIPPLF